MRFRLLALLSCLLVAGVASADILELYPARTITVPTCSSGGGSSISVPKGYYEIHVDNETATVCYAATCATGGMQRRQGNHGATYLSATTSVSCRSTGGSAAVQFVPGDFQR